MITFEYQRVTIADVEWENPSLSAQSPVNRKIYGTFLFTLLSSPPLLIFGLPLYKNIYLYS